MAKKGKIEKEIDTINTSVEAILSEYKIIPKNKAKTIVKKLEKENKKLAKDGRKSQEPMINWDIKKNNEKIRNINNQTDRIEVNYGVATFKIKASYLARIKDKEKYLDGLFNRKMVRILNETQAPKNKGEAKQLEGLITQYSKKVGERPFYNNDAVQNSINKLTNFRKKLNRYDYSNYIDFLRFKEEMRKKKGFKNLSEEELKELFNKGRKPKDKVEEKLYKPVEQPKLVEGYLMGLRFNFL